MKASRNEKPKKREPIFSEKYSVPMWKLINESTKVKHLRFALYVVCCRLQELEAELEKSGALR